KGLAARKYQVQGHIEAPGPPPMSHGASMPDDASLQGPILVVPGVEVVVISGRETLLELKARRVGYLRGKMQLGGGQKTGDFPIHAFQDRHVQPGWRYDQVTGDFLTGPYLAGPLTLQYVRLLDDGSQRNSGRQQVEIVEGQVQHVELKPGALEPD